MKSKKYKLSAMVFYSVIIAIALFLPNMAFAQHWGDFTYRVSGGTVTITGYTCKDDSFDPVPAVIPYTIWGMPVVGIGDGAFAGCSFISSVTIPDSVTSIGIGAFQDCFNLGGVSIGNSVTRIGDGAFRDCYSLAGVTIPKSVTSIGNYAFESCPHLISANFLGNAPSMGVDVFEGSAFGFRVCYTPGATGFTTPTWKGYPASACAVTPPSTTTTVPTNPCAAEAIYGRDSEETELLREYRDKVLSKSATGRQMINTYYELSPAVAEVLQKNDTARANASRVLDSLMPAIRGKVNQ